MTTAAPKIVKTADNVIVMIEHVVRSFAKSNKHLIGADLRREAMKVYRCVDRAWKDSDRRILRLRELSAAVDDLRVTMQAAKRIEAFRSFGQFEAVVREVSSLGKQCGGWLRQLQRAGQNGRATNPVQCAQILSGHAAHGANP